MIRCRKWIVDLSLHGYLYDKMYGSLASSMLDKLHLQKLMSMKRCKKLRFGLLIGAIMLFIIFVASMSISAEQVGRSQLNSGTASESPINIALEAGNYNITKDNEGFDIIKMDGFYYRNPPPGEPMLIHKDVPILLPPDVNFSSLELKIMSARTRILDETYDIKPSPQYASGQNISMTGKNVSYYKNIKIYESNADYPGDYVVMLPPSQMRKWKSVLIDFIPFQYNPVSKKLTLIENVTIEINYRQDTMPAAMAPSLMTDTVMDDLAKKMFVNYDEGSKWYITVNNSALAAPSATQFDYIIITSNAIRNNSTKLNSFIANKQILGHKVLVVTENDYLPLTGDAPNNRAEKIRQWLKDNYPSMGFKYVLLIGNPIPFESPGGEVDVPMKMMWPKGPGDPANSSNWENGVPTDYFYADLNGKWDHNGNGTYGEYADYYPYPEPYGPGVDLQAEVYVGRIPVFNGDYATLNRILQRTIDYETGNASNGPRNAVLANSFWRQDTDSAPLGERLKNDALVPSGYGYYRLYEKGSPICNPPSECCYPNSVYTCETELFGEMKVRNAWLAKLPGLVVWAGHGVPICSNIGWSADPNGDTRNCWDNYIMCMGDCPFLASAPPAFIFSCSCLNGKPEENNLQREMIKENSVSMAAATRISWLVTPYNYDIIPHHNFNEGIAYEYVKRVIQGLPAGDALYQARDIHFQGCNPPADGTQLWSLIEFNLFGDPSLVIRPRTDAPNQPSLIGNSYGQPGTSYTFNTSSIDPNGYQVKFVFDWGDGTSSDTGFVNSGASASASHSWSHSGYYPTRVIAINSLGVNSPWSGSYFVTIDTPPNKPSTPSGPIVGTKNQNYTYTTSSIDPDGDKVKFDIFWGDSSDTWTGLINSGETASAVHSWSDPGMYQVIARATDIPFSYSSLFSDPLTVTLWDALIGRTTPSSPGYYMALSDGHVVIRGTDNDIYHTQFNISTETWSGWTKIPGKTSDIPALAGLSSYDKHLVVRGTDNGIYHKIFNFSTGTWSNWTQIPGYTLSSPALLGVGTTLYMVVRGTDNGIYFNSWTSVGGWSGWQSLNGFTIDVPAIASRPTDLHVVVRGSDNGIYDKVMNLSTGTWSSWTQIPGATISSPTLASWTYNVNITWPYALTLVVRGSDNGIYHKDFTYNSWSEWSKVPGATADKPSMFRAQRELGTEKIEYLAVRGTDNNIYWGKFTNYSWSGWTNVPGTTLSYPVIGKDPNSMSSTMCLLAVRGPDNLVWVMGVDPLEYLAGIDQALWRNAFATSLVSSPMNADNPKKSMRELREPRIR